MSSLEEIDDFADDESILNVDFDELERIAELESTFLQSIYGSK